LSLALDQVAPSPSWKYLILLSIPLFSV